MTETIIESPERVQKVLVEAAPSDQPRWPEVIGLINDTRAQLAAQISEVSAKFDKWILPTENRLTLVEANQATHTKEIAEHRESIRKNAEAIKELQGRQEQDEAATKALQDADDKAAAQKQSKLDWRHWAIGTVLTVVLAIPGIQEIYHQIHP